MSNSSQTVQVLATQVGLMREELELTRALMLELMKEMLRIAQTQADTTRDLTAAFTSLVQATQISGSGSSRVLTDDAEYQEWRKEVRERSSAFGTVR